MPEIVVAALVVANPITRRKAQGIVEKVLSERCHMLLLLMPQECTDAADLSLDLLVAAVADAGFELQVCGLISVPLGSFAAMPRHPM